MIIFTCDLANRISKQIIKKQIALRYVITELFSKMIEDFLYEFLLHQWCINAFANRLGFYISPFHLHQ